MAFSLDVFLELMMNVKCECRTGSEMRVLAWRSSAASSPGMSTCVKSLNGVLGSQIMLCVQSPDSITLLVGVERSVVGRATRLRAESG